MRRKPSRQLWQRAVGVLLLALLCLAATLRLAPLTAWASTINVHYEDTFDDVMATEETAAEVKAAFLLRFPDFVGWEHPLGDTLRIGVTGDSALASMLVRLADQENQSGLGSPYRLEVTEITEGTSSPRCDILVMGADVDSQRVATLVEAHNSGTLTVGVWNEPRGETIIRLYREGSRVRFAISQTLAKEAGLLISSKLLNLAGDRSSREPRVVYRTLRG